MLVRVALLLCPASAAGTAALFALPGSLSAAASRRRISRVLRTRARAWMRERSRRGQGCPLSEPRSLLAKFAGQEARQTADARVPFSLVTFFWASKRK